MIKKGCVRLRDYILAMEIARQYEDQLKQSKTSDQIMARCHSCNLMFVYKISKETEQGNQGGTSVFYGDCPYCGERTEVLRV